jgi:hypothetical protein
VDVSRAFRFLPFPPLLINEFLFLQNDQGYHFDSTNTLMVDDTPSKLRAQPYTLVAAPTYDYPLVPSPSTSAALLDTFLLSLVGMLVDIEGESNFANFVKAEGWNLGLDEEEKERFERKGLRALKKAGVAVEADGRGPVEGVIPSVSDRVRVWSSPEERRGVQGVSFPPFPPFPVVLPSSSAFSFTFTNVHSHSLPVRLRCRSSRRCCTSSASATPRLARLDQRREHGQYGSHV